MRIYVEQIFLENFIVNILIMYQTGLLLNLKLPKMRNVLSSLITSAYSVFFAINQNMFFTSIFFKIIIINIGVYIVFRPKTIAKNIKVLFSYIILNTLFLGIIIFFSIYFNINLNNTKLKYIIFFISFISVVIIRKNLFNLWKIRKKEESFYYTLRINDGYKKIDMRAFVDTGNSVKYNNNNEDVDVIFVSKSKEFNNIEKVSKEQIKIDINSIGGMKNLNGYLVNDIEILKGTDIIRLDKAYIVFCDHKLSGQEDFDAIISFNTYIEKIQGVSI